MKLTIFTPVYNRRVLLGKLYESLLKQTVYEFIWMIVDDGSTDCVGEDVIDWKAQAPFEIVYIRQENQGKHIAHNTAVEACKTPLFVCVDSDDRLLPNAVEKILEIDCHELKKDIMGYYFRKIDTKGIISGGEFDLSSPYVGLRELYHKYNFKGELVIVLKTKYAKRASFPAFSGERFVSELVYYNELDRIAPMRWVDDVIYEYEYQDSGYSRNSNRLIANNPYGAAVGYLSEAKYATKCLQKAKSYAEYLAICKVFGLEKTKVEHEIQMEYYFVEHKLANLLMRHYEKLFLQIKKGER